LDVSEPDEPDFGLTLNPDVGLIDTGFILNPTPQRVLKLEDGDSGKKEE
jgi:hypothetical protein